MEVCATKYMCQAYRADTDFQQLTIVSTGWKSSTDKTKNMAGLHGFCFEIEGS